MLINLLKPGDAVLGFFLLKSMECKTSSNNKKYLDLTLADKTGEINGKLWDCTEEDETGFHEHILVKVKGLIGEWQNRLQLKIEKIRPAGPQDEVSMEDFIPTAPESSEQMYGVVLRYVEEIKNKDIQKIVSRIIAEKKDRLLFYPAAKQNHHAVKAGLLYHIKTMLVVAEKLSTVYPWINRDLLYGGIILHDMGKIDEMAAGEIGLIVDYTVEGQLLGHIVQGIKEIDQIAKEEGVDEEVSLLLQHMLLSHHYEPEFGSPKRPMIPEAELLHYIDMIDARMFDMKNALENTTQGQFSERVWVLHNRKLYKTSFHPPEGGDFEHAERRG
ncbi:3'-5' exoribonuclease YhaM family protein [Candidatus Formimonas warabiya]|uniref:CMP-binding protein n=1 Tax=Formimonas warabiya TaxID=1761012 RepID=A0A3G1KLY8_FORW1|nr:HD domain-containing protein [Candidatus Formimonas warabiya]ATW23443.1 CMP-binding protein [Candidatus Formimonas warabiya]